MDENKEMNCTCETNCGSEPKADLDKIRCEVIKLDDDVPEADDVIVIPVSEYKHLIRCEAAVQLLDKLLNKYGEYSSERAKIMTIACEIIGKETGKKEEDPFDA